MSAFDYWFTIDHCLLFEGRTQAR